MTSMPHQPPSPRLARLASFLAEDPANTALAADVFDLALAEGAFDLAAQCVARAQAGAHDAPAWQHRQAMLAIARGDHAQAERLLDMLEASQPGHPAIAYNRALVEFRSARFDAALGRLLPLLERGDALPQTLALALRCLHALHRPDAAVQLFEQYRGSGRADPAAAGVAALAAVDANRMSDAAAWSALALGGVPDQPEALVAAGTVALARQDTDGAISRLQHALERIPGDGRTLSGLGIAHMLRIEPREAVRCFEQALAVMPQHIGTWHGLGWCRIMQKEFGAAREAFEQALKLDRNFAESHGGLAVVLAMEGQRAEAEAAIERALRLDPNNVSGRYARALLDGEATDVARFGRMAERLLGGRTGVDGASLIELVLKRRS